MTLMSHVAELGRTWVACRVALGATYLRRASDRVQILMDRIRGVVRPSLDAAQEILSNLGTRLARSTLSCLSAPRSGEQVRG